MLADVFLAISSIVEGAHESTGPADRVDASPNTSLAVALRAEWAHRARAEWSVMRREGLRGAGEVS